MSNMCLVITPNIKELAEKIRQKYPEIENFTDQRCAEWIGMYNKDINQSPDYIPSADALVKHIEKAYNKEGKSVLRNLEAEQEMQEIKAKAQADGTFMKAPNGKPTNLTERQWLQVRTKAFKDWFGDWINERIYTNKLYSKKLPDLSIEERKELTKRFNNGEEIIVYASTNALQKIKQEGIKFTDSGASYEGKELNVFYASLNPSYAQGYAEEYYTDGTDISNIGIIKIKIKNNSGRSIIEGQEVRIRDLSDIIDYEEVNLDKNPHKELIYDKKSDNVSKVVDENGEPLVVYRIDTSDFTIFDKSKLETTRKDFFGIGFYFSNDLESVKTHYKEPDREPRSFFLNMRSFDTYDYQESNLEGEIHRDRIITFESADDFFLKEFIVKNPNQIKSATDNNGEFSNENNDIQMTIGEAATTPSQESQVITQQLINHLKSMDINVHNREEMIKYLNEHGYNSIQEATNKRRVSINNKLSSQEKSNVRNLLKTINKTGTTLLENGEGTMYLLDHTDREGIENRNPKKEDGFNCRLKFSTDGYTNEEIQTIKNEIENGNIRDQKSFNKWVKLNLNQQGGDNSDSIIAEVRASNESDDRLHLQASGGEPFGGRSNTSSPEDFGTGWIKIPNSDGTNSPRYILIGSNEESFYLTPQGEIYGFVAPNGDIYLDETVVSPEHPIHEYTHLWDRALAKSNPELWQRGIELMKNLALWKEIEDSDNYGKKWKALNGMTDSKLESLIASEVHARLVGENSEKLLNQIVEENGNKGIIDKLKQWILDVWKDLKATFGNWSQEEINKLTLKDFNHMTVRDFADGINLTTALSPNASKPEPIRPYSPAYESALKVTENRTTQFYQTFTPQQIKDRGTMISDYFSDIIDDFIDEEIDTLLDTIESDEATEQEKQEARQLRNLYRDPINGRQYAVNKLGVATIISQIKDKIKRNAESHEGVEQQLWQNTLDFFTELFNNQAALEIEEQEGIRIIGLQNVDISSDAVALDDQDEGDDETGHTVSGNDGWLFQVRFENPAASLSKKVRRMLYNIERSSNDVDDLGHIRKYPSGQIYATLLSYLAKNMQDSDAFMQVTSPDNYDDDTYDHYGNIVNEQMYPNGYPTFPVLEKMREQYPWVEQIINRLTDDYLAADWNTSLAYPSTYGAMASQFYSNFRKAFIPYAKIQFNGNKGSIIPLNIEMEARCQKDKLEANYNNGIVLTDTSIYNQDTTINREHAEKLKEAIRDFTDNDNIRHAYNLYRDLSDENTIVEEEDINEFNDFTDRAVFILNSFGISSTRENVAALLAQSNGQTFSDMMKDLSYIADTISKVSDDKAKNYNYMLDLRYVGGEPVWRKFFNGRGLITDESYLQSFYDSATKKTRYSYSADNYLQKTFRGLFNPDREERRAFIEDRFMKYEWFYNHKTNTWKNKWLERLYDAQDITNELPYKNINNITVAGDTPVVRDYRNWEASDIWHVQNDSYKDNAAYCYYLAPIFSDSPMSMTVKGPVLGSQEVLDAFVSLVDQELQRIKYVNEDRAEAIKEGTVKPIANFDDKRGREFCFIPELNDYTLDNGEKFLDVLIRKRKDRSTSKEEIENLEKRAIIDIMTKKASEYVAENLSQYNTEKLDREALLRNYMNMAYANVSIIQFSTIDLAFYTSDTDFQKRFKEVYAGGIQLNTNSRYGKKTENTILLADDIITSPSYDSIAEIINGISTLSKKDKEHILSTFRDINVADAQAIRSMHSFRSVMDMMGRWDERAQEALDNFEKGQWNREDFDVIYQSIKPFVYSVIDRNDGLGGVIPVPQQHKNSEICALMMYSLITNNLNSPVYEALSRFMDTKGSNGEYLVDMAQFESAGKVGNQGVININFNPENVIKAISKEWDDNNKKDQDIKDILDRYTLDTAQVKEGNRKRFLPNDVDNAEANYKAIKEQLDSALVNKKISQEDYNKVFAYFRPTADEIVSILEQKVLVNQPDGSKVINSEVVHTIPFDNYYQSQPTPEHHIDAQSAFGSQARNIIVADLPDNFSLTLEGKNGQKSTIKGRDAIIDFYYELLDENLIEDFFGSNTKKGLKEIFSSKENLRDAVTNIVRGNPKYGKDFIDALKTDSAGNFVLSPNSPTMFTLMQELVTSLFKNHITKQKINGAALIQAAGIGLDDSLRLVKDSKGNIVGAQCLMPLTSKRFFEPLLEEKEVNGEKVKILNPEKLREAGLDKAVGYRIPTENKSSMLPLIITGFTPLQNGSSIILPAEITALAGSDFDVDKMYVMLSEFYIDKDGLHRVEYDFSKSPKENGRRARNNMVIQMMYNILTSKAGNESLLNPQGFADFKDAAKLNKILSNKVIMNALREEYANDDDLIEYLLNTSTKEKEDIIKDNSAPESPIYPQTFTHSHARNMAGTIQIGIYALQGSMAAKYQRAHINLKENQQFTLNGRTLTNVDISENGKRLKRVGEMIGASADNGKDPNLSDAGSTSKTAAIIGYMLRLGLTHQEAVLVINQPVMKECGYSADNMEKKFTNIKRLPVKEVNTKMLVKNLIDQSSISADDQMAISAMCYRILKQHEYMEQLTMISRADSPKGAMQNSFAKARVQQYKVELFNAQMRQSDFPFYPISEVINNKSVDVSKGEDVVREQLKAQPMAFLHGMYGLGINSLQDLASPYFFMLSKHFDDNIVKPILYNQNSNYGGHLEELVNDIYLSYINYVLSSSPLFGDEKDDNGDIVTTMKSKREYYKKSFADDFAKTLQNNEAIRNALGNILQKNGNRVVLKDVGSLAKGQKDVISRRFDALMALGDEGQKLAKDLLLYSYYDTGLNFTHDSFSSRLSTYFLTQFPAFKEILQELNNPLTEEQEQNFIYQFLSTYPSAAYNVDKKVDPSNVKDGQIIVDMNDWRQNRNFTNVILSPNPKLTGVQPYPYVYYDGSVYILDADAYDLNKALAIYNKMDHYPTNRTNSIFNMNKSIAQLADEYANVNNEDVKSQEDTTMAHNDSNDNPDIDNSDVEMFDNFDDMDLSGVSATPTSQSNNYKNEGQGNLEVPFC